MGLAKRSAHLMCGIALCFVAIGQRVQAQESSGQVGNAESARAEGTVSAPSGLNLELNRLEQNGAACRATLIARNGFDSGLDEAGFELVMFDEAGLISLMTVFDFGMLPAGKTMVRRFDLPETDCSGLTRILVNGVSRCAGDGIDIARCQTNFTTDNRAEIEFGR